MSGDNATTSKPQFRMEGEEVVLRFEISEERFIGVGRGVKFLD
jgi:hypothetical protein